MNLGEVSIDGPNMKGLLVSVMIGKFGKIMETIKTQNFRMFLAEIGGQYHQEDKILFDTLIAQYVNMKECFMEKQFINRD